jgi:excisionase family DNA binding protein
MVVGPRAEGGELSTARSCGALRVHNRRMVEASTPEIGRFLTIADVALEMNVSVNQAYALVRSGELPAIKVGAAGHWRIERSRFEAYIAALYEEQRRHDLWNQIDYSDVADHAPRR